MKQRQTIFHRSVAYVLLVSFLLQSCNNTNIPINKEEVSSSKRAIKGLPISVRENNFTTEGYIYRTNSVIEIRVKEREGNLEATITDTQGGTKYERIPVALEAGADLRELTKLPTAVQKNRIKVINYPVTQRLIITKPALQGGMMEGEGKKDKGKEKEESEENENKEEISDNNYFSATKPLKGEKDITVILNEGLKGEYQLGEATDTGDCFFDALAQHMNIRNYTDVNTIAYLRRLCHDYYMQNKAEVDEWHQADYGGLDKGREEYYMVQYTAEECAKHFNGRAPIWGRPWVEGKILTRQLNIEGLLFIEVLKDGETGKPVASYHLVTKDSYESMGIEKFRKLMQERDLPVLVNAQDSLHYVPFLKAGIVKAGCSSHTGVIETDNEQRDTRDIQIEDKDREKRKEKIESKMIETKKSLQDKEKGEPDEKKSASSSGCKRILSLDGGGIRGILEAATLTYLEEEIESIINRQYRDLHAPLADVRLGEGFDLVAGTSTGGIIALAMRMINPSTNRPKLKMREVLSLYQDKGDVIFPSVSKFSGWLSSKYSPTPLENLLKEYFGDNKLSNLGPPTMITGYDTHKEGLYLFKSWQGERNAGEDYMVRDVARATSAAPTYFPAAAIRDISGRRHTFVDGGVAANNPTMHAYQEAKELFGTSSLDVVSIGTGSDNLLSLYKKVNGGKLNWASDITSVLMSSNSQIVDDLATRASASDNNSYVRLQFNLDQRAADLDNVTPENIQNLLGYVRRKTSRENVDSKLKEIEQSLLKYYQERNYYIFYDLVADAYQQLQVSGGEVNLSNKHLSERAVWELVHGLKSLQRNLKVESLNIKDNFLKPSSLGYLKELRDLKVLDVSSTGLDKEGLQVMQKGNLRLDKLVALANPRLKDMSAEELILLLEKYKQFQLDPSIQGKIGNYYATSNSLEKACEVYGWCTSIDNQLNLAKLWLRYPSSSTEFDKGFKLLEKLAKEGNSEAQCSMGRFYHRTEQDIYAYLINKDHLKEEDYKVMSLKKAGYWYKLAADGGSKHAALSLANMYWQNEIMVPIPVGEARDNRHQLKTAIHYYELAQKLGNKTAAEKSLIKLRKELQDVVKVS